jgi:hypothetical protein
VPILPDTNALPKDVEVAFLQHDVVERRPVVRSALGVPIQVIGTDQPVVVLVLRRPADDPEDGNSTMCSGKIPLGGRTLTPIR